MPSKEPLTCPVCQRPGIVNISQHLNGVHSICGQERKRLIRGGLVATELMTREPQSNIEKHVVFLDMLQRGEVLRGEAYPTIQYVFRCWIEVLLSLVQ